MEKKRFCGAAALLLVTAAVLACAGGDVEARKLAPAPDPEETMSSERAKQILRAYFADQYSEAGCSAVYTDLTHDGVEELLVLELRGNPEEEPILLHSGAIEAERFREGRVTVLTAEEEGVSTLCEYTCGTDTSAWGGLYLEKRGGLVCLLLCTPDGGTACFFLNNDGTRGDISAEESPEEEVKPILVWNPEADMAQERFTYLDELFTTY